MESLGIDPKVTDHTLSSRSEQEWWLLFCIAVAGWNSDTAAKALGRFKFYIDSPKFPLMHINDVMYSDPDVVEWAFIHSRFRFGRTKRTFIEAAREFWCRDLSEITTEELETIHGIGPKTSRFYLLSIVPGARYAALDTHILKWLASLGYERIPKSTPTGGNYRRIEGYFLQEADERGKEPAELDLEVWTAYKEGRLYD